jgi:hypothetical protein
MAATLFGAGVAQAGQAVTVGVNFTVAPLLSVSAPSPISFGTLNPGQTSTVNLPVTVRSNILPGYSLAATRTAFESATVPVRMAIGASTVFSVVPATPPGLPVGQGSITPAAGDVWSTRLRAGPVSCPRRTRRTITYTATLTLTATTPSATAIAAVPMQVRIRCRGEGN